MLSNAATKPSTSEEPGGASRVSAAVAITATFTAELIEEPLGFWLHQLCLNLPIVFAPYNQVFQSLLDSTSIVSNNRGINVVLLRWQDLGTAEHFEANVDSLIEALRSAASRSSQPLIVMVCPPSPEDANNPRFADAEAKLNAAVAGLSAVKLLLPSLYGRWYPMAEACDTASDRIGHIPYTSAGFAALATALARRVDGLDRPPFKVVVLDCDNTLWRGILGEDGVHGINIGPEYQALQRFMMAQRDSGMLLTICSKNNETDVEEAFRLREDMPLRRTDFVTSRINWGPKSANLRELARELDLGLDSFIFIDDSPTECAEVQAGCPEVLTLQLPQKSAEIPAFLDHVWAFDHWQVTGDDQNRTAVYVQKLERERVEKQATNIADFIASLQLQIDIHPMKVSELARVSQLTQRTNQFNCTTIRRSESDIEALLTNGYECLTVDVSDRFGHYGLVGVVIYRTVPTALEVDSFLMSCRALGRGVEYHVIQNLGRIAVSRGLQRVSIHYKASLKNAPARLFLEGIAGEYKREQGDAFSLELPAEYAAEVTYRPADAVSIVQETPKKAVAAEPTRFRNYYRIASELRSPTAIVEEMRRMRPAGVSRVGTEFDYRSDDERQLAAIWAEGLGFEEVGRDANFFEIGGHSLLAVRLLARILEKWPYQQLTIAAFLQAPTVAEFAALLQSGARISTACIVPFREHGSRPPFFCLPGAGGNVVSLRSLAASMSQDQPFYCLQAKGLDGTEPLRTVEEAARFYVEQVRAVQPQGPYYIGGGCFGGLIAFEMARTLTHQGEQVGLLALIDTYNFAYGRTLSKPHMLYENVRFFARRISHHVQHLKQVPWEDRFDYLSGRAAALRHYLSDLLAISKGEARNQIPVGGFPAQLGEEAGRLQISLNRVIEASLEAARIYMPQYYPGNVVLFKASDRVVEPYEDAELGWGPYAKHVEVKEIEGDHGSIMFAPRVENISRQIEAAIEQNSRAIAAICC